MLAALRTGRIDAPAMWDILLAYADVPEAERIIDIIIAAHLNRMAKNAEKSVVLPTAITAVPRLDDRDGLVRYIERELKAALARLDPAAEIRAAIRSGLEYHHRDVVLEMPAGGKAVEFRQQHSYQFLRW